MWLRCGPLPPGLLDAAGAQSTVVVDRDSHPDEALDPQPRVGLLADRIAQPSELVRDPGAEHLSHERLT